MSDETPEQCVEHWQDIAGNLRAAATIVEKSDPAGAVCMRLNSACFEQCARQLDDALKPQEDPDPCDP